MTFPSYRPLVFADPARRLALGASVEGEPVGLGLVERLAAGGARLLSLYVVEALRGRGLATALVERLEHEAREAGDAELSTVWMTGQSTSAAVERVLAKRGWEPPALRMYVLRCDHPSIDRAPWMKLRLAPGVETFLWKDLTDADREALLRRQEETPVPAEVFPFNARPDFEPNTSLGVRWRGEVVGWVVNHRFDAKTLRFTCSYLRDELQGRGRLIAVYAEVINRMRPIGLSEAIWSVPVTFPRMVAFTRRHLMPYATSITETRGSRKSLV